MTSRRRIDRSFRRHRRREKLASIITAEIILDELDLFLHEHYSDQGEALLDLGAGSKPYAPIYESHFERCTSVDVPFSPHDISGIDVVASADSLPFEDSSFDCVICTEVLEHCSDPGAVMGEVHRVLKPGGRLFLTTPFLAPLHEMPNDFYRYTPSALRELASQQGLLVTSLRPRGEYFAVAVRVLQMPWTKLWQGLSRVIGIRLYHPLNPLVYLTIVLPQRLYVALWRRVNDRGGWVGNFVRDRLSYYTPGYVTTLQRPE